MTSKICMAPSINWCRLYPDAWQAEKGLKLQHDEFAGLFTNK